MNEYSPYWPDELKEAERTRFRAECRLRNLTAQLDRVPPSEFDALMDLIEKAREDGYRAGRRFWELNYNFQMAQYMKEHSGEA